jgi:hypothetical protein
MIVNKFNGTTPFDATGDASQRERLYQALARAGDEKTFQALLSQCQAPGSADSGTLRSPDLSATANSVAGASKNPLSEQNSGVQASGGQPTCAPNHLAESVLLSHAALKSRNVNFGSLGSGMPAGSAAGSMAYAKNRGVSSNGGVSSASGTEEIGSLAALFESGERGVAAIGYDDGGGTSYGTYQIASKTGTMKYFLDYLDDTAPAWARRLRAAGPANTGGRSGRMPEEWKRIASEDPVRFDQVQKDFIEVSHYQPARQEILEKTGLDVERMPDALREVLWSTSVQHGPKGAAGIFRKAIERVGKTQGGGLASLIQSVYNSRAKHFGQSSVGVRSAVASRFREEMKMALAMLEDSSVSGRSATNVVA